MLFRGRRFDTGSKTEYIKAVLEIALDRPDLGPELRPWLKQFADWRPFASLRTRPPGEEEIFAGPLPVAALEAPRETRVALTRAVAEAFVAGLVGGEPICLEGPGIKTRKTIAPSDLRQDFWTDQRL